MEMIVDFPGGARVDAHFGPYTVATDQPTMGGGTGSAPTPFAVFLASIATCAGIYVLGYGVAVAILFFVYPLTKAKTTEMLEQLKARRAEKASAMETDGEQCP